MSGNYILSSIVRVKQFNPTISELLYKKPMRFRYKPGDKVKLLDYNKYYYIASGVQEPWARIIIDNKLYINTPTIRLEREPINDIPDLIGAEPSKTVFICNDLGIAPALSFCSTYPSDKLASIIYKHSEEGVNEAWLNANQNVTHIKNFNDKLNSIPIQEDYNYYICCTDKENALIKDYLLNQGVSYKVMFLSTII